MIAAEKEVGEGMKHVYTVNDGPVNVSALAFTHCISTENWD